MRRLFLGLLCALFASTTFARPVSDTTTLEGEDSLVLIKLSSNMPAEFTTLSLVRWEDERISTSLAEYYSIPNNGGYVLIKQSIAGTFYPYNIEGNERSAQGRKMLFGKTLKGSLVQNGQVQYRYTLLEGKINYIGDITIKSDQSGQQVLIINDNVESARQFVLNNYPTLFEQYPVVDALITSQQASTE